MDTLLLPLYTVKVIGNQYLRTVSHNRISQLVSLTIYTACFCLYIVCLLFSFGHFPLDSIYSEQPIVFCRHGEQAGVSIDL